MTRQAESGYALVAAVAAIGFFTSMALAVFSATQFWALDAEAEQTQMRASAAADAGVAMAVSGLLSDTLSERWSIDGRLYSRVYLNARLYIRVEDERGKIPISQLNDKLATRLLEEAGLSGDRLLIARDSLLDWTDEDDSARSFGAEAPYYAAAGVRPPNGFLLSVEELRSIRGFDEETVARIRSIITTTTSVAGFDARYATPQALAVMRDGGDMDPAAIERTRELAGQRTAIEFVQTDTDLMGRPLMIHSEAILSNGGRAQRRVIIELTGEAERPFIVKAYE